MIDEIIITTETINLKDIIDELINKFPSISSVFYSVREHIKLIALAPTLT